MPTSSSYPSSVARAAGAICALSMPAAQVLREAFRRSTTVTAFLKARFVAEKQASDELGAVGHPFGAMSV